ncbi:hypothetical protein T265_02312 [Opisthorchis viverrini]|uniref:Uncharacterized protein n=1 Tax=Opisthorchis viverrini TaxID=6198 RepID=A0A075AIC5_OPIVI|nr:hypothetical protein T265_02312 [Opisthorchis viverrini]KER31394.1 hypothetical protein T265_02312 [Opisthorchis viverrini]
MRIEITEKKITIWLFGLASFSRLSLLVSPIFPPERFMLVALKTKNYATSLAHENLGSELNMVSVYFGESAHKSDNEGQMMEYFASSTHHRHPKLFNNQSQSLASVMISIIAEMVIRLRSFRNQWKFA